MKSKIKVDEKTYYEIIEKLKTVREWLSPLSYYDASIKKAYDHICEVLYVFNDCEHDRTIPAGSMSGKIKYALADIDSFLNKQETYYNLDQEVELLSDVLQIIQGQRMQAMC